jgi:hypothetical protein
MALAAGVAFRWSAPIPAALFLLGAEYAAFLAVEDAPVDTRAPLVAAALLVTAELSYWSLELRAAVTEEPGSLARRLTWTLALALTGLVLAAVTLALVDLVDGDGLWIEALGALAAIAALVLLLASARRSGADPG